ncbi:hypothetical protein [Urinicoccus massiliensis]|uniref:hypothetical protein n=1 Tax=Urinicoccus massiliensis TaxID=1723382 RepID=UPI0009301182|nr:hypothetical protein [Urinicoccus massiliensis]
MKENLESAFALIQRQLEEKDQEIDQLKKENAVLQKEFDRVCQMLSQRQRQEDEAQGFFRRLFPKKKDPEDQLVLAEGPGPEKEEVPEDLGPKDCLIQALERGGQDLWPRALVSYLEEGPSQDDLLDLLVDFFPRGRLEDLKALLDILDEDSLEKFMDRREDFSLVLEDGSLSRRQVYQVLRLYYLKEDWTRVDRALDLVHRSRDPLKAKDLKILYLLSLTRPIPLPSRDLSALEDLADPEETFKNLVLTFKKLPCRENFSQTLAREFPQAQDQKLLCLAYTKL